MPGIGIGISPYLRRGGGGFASDFLFRTLDLGIDVPAGLVARDGAQLVYNEGKLHLIGGWNPAEFAATNDSTNEHWVNATPDDPTGWAQLSDAAFDPVHTFGCVSKDGFIWKFGNDLSYPGKTSYKYNEAGGWTLVSAAMTGDWGDRYIAGCCVHKGKFYAAGGVDNLPGNYLTSVIESTDCINWTQVGTLSPHGGGADIAAWFSPILVSDGSNLYLWGGGIYLSTGQDGVYKSTDNGATWNIIATLPSVMTGTYQNGAYFEGKFWHLQGFRSGANRRGLYYTTDFQTWTQLYDNPLDCHASGFGVADGKLYRLTGNLDNFYYSVEGIVTPENTIPTGAEAIYSVRNHPNFVGSYAMEVQRSSDNTTLDIGFVGNDIDEAAMTTFMGVGDLYVSKWYDRSGNGNHATNTLGNRPRIGSGGVLDKVNGKVAAYHSSGNVRFVLDSSINISNQHSIFTVVNFTANDREFIGGGGNTFMVYRATGGSSFNANGHSANGFGEISLSQSLLTDVRDVRIYTRFVDGQAFNFSRPVSGTGDFIITNLSGESDPAYNFVGYMQEVIIYAGDKLQEKSGIEQNINDYYSIY